MFAGEDFTPALDDNVKEENSIRKRKNGREKMQHVFGAKEYGSDRA